jgi:hypothetical protein
VQKRLDSGTARKRAHPGMMLRKTKRRTVITLSHSKQPAGLQLFVAIANRAIFHFAVERRILVLDLFSRHVMLWP